MRQTYLKISLILFTFISLFGCNKNRYDVDITGIEFEIEIERLEGKLSSFNNDGFEEELAELIVAEPAITEVLIEQVIMGGRLSNPNYNVLKRFFLDSNYAMVTKDIQEKFIDISDITSKLNSAFKYVKYYYPNDSLPTKAYTINSGFRVPGFTYADIIAISLDWYMGQGYEYYHSQVFPLYRQRRMNEDYIVSQVLKAYFTNKYPLEEHTDGTLLSEMIYWGKQLEFAKLMMPNTPDSIIVEYTANNLKWCAENEGMIYNHFVERKLWFETDQNLTYRYVSDGPYTVAPDVPISSAPRIGWFIGWQIVRGYLDNEDDDPVKILFENSDYKDIFKKAKYKP